ncbi:DUF6492 family protein [Butyrivibrio sp. INlla14]|uniref:DUF6492 family protein n=1 Tax=Butyrivibrio sp. INlla14 TaxID=1520808 RepID=UPI0008773161|nr:DUF6492 family protein [Butyrivibrio sp. INlla14]SCY73142.1 hypothetical protein SAMN02910371_03629 [Butyrivibrio sp. INlla14]
MLNFAFLLKTYGEDYSRAKKLIISYRRFNEDSIKLFLVCPDTDKELFAGFAGDDVSIISEETICSEVFTEDTNFTAGYLNQEIYKLAFWELKLCENYMCLDSDALFIRPFYIKDFIYEDAIPYTVLIEDNDLCADNYYNQMYWVGRRKQIAKIEDAIGYHPHHLLTCHGFQIFSGTVLKSLKEDFMAERGYEYKDLIQIAPYEFSWYNLWLQKTKKIPINPIEPLFKTIHLKQHHINYYLAGMRFNDWARSYVGIIVNSNYGVGSGEYEDLSVYNYDNADIPDDIIVNNYRFYKKLMAGRILRRAKSAVKRILRHGK